MIGVFDSGLGGLSVLAALVDALPQADFIYFADTAHVPYGNKSEEQIQCRVLAIGEHLASHGCDLLVVACNTATATAVQALRAAHPRIPVVGIEPGIKPAAQETQSGRIAVLATEATARSPRLKQLILEHASHVEVFVEPCPGWATHVEKLHLDDPALAADVRARVEPLLERGVDRIVLGCTHYSFLAPLLGEVVGSRAQLVDVAAAVARQAQRLAGRLAHGCGRLQLHASAHPDRLRAALPQLHLGRIAARVQAVPPRGTPSP
ncbi:MAG: glutamate racemase [Rhodocyclales bacterium GWA2_65_20]|nr:MAG: glutamate racemase [Rhodocyclales bacterium GWA2_65_20]